MSDLTDLTAAHRLPVTAQFLATPQEPLAAVIDLAERRRTSRLTGTPPPRPVPCRPCTPFCCTRGTTTPWRCPLTTTQPCPPCGGAAA